MFNKTEVILIHQKNHLPREMESKDNHLSHCPLARPTSQSFPRQFHQLGTKHSDIWTYEDHSHSSCHNQRNSGKKACVLDFLISVSIFQIIHLLRLTLCVNIQPWGWKLTLHFQDGDCSYFSFALLFKHRVSLWSLSSPGWPWVCDPP